ncbi:hypothetical protein AHMF7605_07905 [Adhaeribacter arboris]|uniref:DinB-like domain-containing protein n=1 Tax=Adhaeribacter arboris TaxID=2072846 RepID=A0A2T2YD78_9BACT|nr:DinB family protein [Adhaeribacter arboris]PSR53454.1 hypothetical protein AHMF7605_07905 [Adhaeribacter arboris]
MENYYLEQDVAVFGLPVKTFPLGIGEAFDALQNQLPKDNRPFYGISECTPAGIVYLATTLQKTENEPEKYGYNPYIIEKGDYLAVIVRDWLTKTDSIKNVFTQMFTDERSDRNKPCVEIYKNSEEMICLVKVKTPETKNLADYIAHVGPEFEKTTQELAQLFSSLSPDEINQNSSAGNWTAGQLIQHVLKVNSGFLRILNGPVKETERNPAEQVANIKANLLDFTTKRRAGDFVTPENKTYQKEELLHALENIRVAVHHVIQISDLTPACLAFEVPVFGFLTRLEAIYFVIYHTQRHTQQLKNIIEQLATSSN